MKKIIITMYEPSDFEQESNWSYNDQSWLDIEVDGEVYRNLSRAGVTVSALPANAVFLGCATWDVDLDLRKAVN